MADKYIAIKTSPNQDIWQIYKYWYVVDDSTFMYKRYDDDGIILYKSYEAAEKQIQHLKVMDKVAEMNKTIDNRT